jgi:hypothetical protein
MSIPFLAILSFLGFLLFVVLLFKLLKPKQYRSHRPPYSVTRRSSFPSDIKPSGSKLQEPLTDSEKGAEFEKYVVARFNQQFFKLINWRSDKFHNGVYALSNMDPDLHYRFQCKSTALEFAVECKWRKGFFDGEIFWAKDYQIANYFSYQQKRKIPVYIIIGVGGIPSAPREVFIIPLKEILQCGTTVHFNILNQYRRNNADKYFYLDTATMVIR